MWFALIIGIGVLYERSSNDFERARISFICYVENFALFEHFKLSKCLYFGNRFLTDHDIFRSWNVTGRNVSKVLSLYTTIPSFLRNLDTFSLQKKILGNIRPVIETLPL